MRISALKITYLFDNIIFIKVNFLFTTVFVPKVTQFTELLLFLWILKNLYLQQQCDQTETEWSVFTQVHLQYTIQIITMPFNALFRNNVENIRIHAKSVWICLKTALGFGRFLKSTFAFRLWSDSWISITPCST